MDSRFLDVNAHGVLRIPGPLWLAFALLARYWVLLVFVAVSARRDPAAVVLLGGGINWWLMGLELPAVALAFVAGRRAPDAGDVVRFLWRHGRALMVFAAAINLMWTGMILWQSDYWTLWPELFLASCCVLDLAIVLSACTTPLLKQLFLEFPSKPVEGVQS
jgi:hypothetical protein